MHIVASENAIVVDNLRTAFEGETNTHALYAEFAEKADGEGWHGVASLFRAAAVAERIHTGNHGRILQQLGGKTDVTAKPVDLRGTLENLRTALAGEMFEVNTMYPAFVKQARECRDVTVVRTFTWALEAEKTHVRLFNEALGLVEFEDEESWVTLARDFYVCPVCGYTSEQEYEAAMCRVCNCAWMRFEVVR